ncbi:glutamine-hydrolyzing carbamoyl-phosphate synthase small subunit [Aurantibacillus circumpalustris]|uniref:glutamine-hydrolyzing carbamoyl-phosphate synthase small subunit n=1 Tax=Aurantibacillus circumpalustris TaxID=3036359 RepID=UPI00295AA3EA|nr:glutamine-hydrolyzing carbamoyl-phosphate synthase small subunit [Aurantibacillus circumpalustris]
MQLKYSSLPKAILLLEDGKVFEGKAAGKIGTTSGEICFNTGMSGYQEIFTDPSYFGQIVVMTNSHIGNYGVEENEVESDSIKIAGMVCKKFNQGFSRARAQKSLGQYFEESNIVSICDVDTRAIVRHIRDKGAMNCIISSEILDVEVLKKQLAKVPSMEGLELSSKVSCKTAYNVGNEKAKYKVAVMDYGAKKNILRSLVERDCYLKVFPMNASAKDLAAFNPDGIMLSNGPGDPGVMKKETEAVKDFLALGKPLFGICLGHQLLAQSQGISTYKMHTGHRGINHPVQNIISGKSEITSQNHGFTVNEKEINSNPNLEISHVNLNDKTIEGIRLKNYKAFSVQYHPEACPGPLDARYLFDEFVGNMEAAKG